MIKSVDLIMPLPPMKWKFIRTWMTNLLKKCKKNSARKTLTQMEIWWRISAKEPDLPRSNNKKLRKSVK